MGQFLSLWMEIQNCKIRMKLFIFNRKGIVHVLYAYVLLSLYTVFPLCALLWPLTFYMILFFPISFKFEHRKIYQDYHVYSSCAPSPRKSPCRLCKKCIENNAIGFLSSVSFALPAGFTISHANLDCSAYFPFSIYIINSLAMSLPIKQRTPLTVSV